MIAEKTGYPPEMLELDMALDADLGIDSIKRVEILSALQERLPEAPLIKPEHLGTLHNLRQIAAFLADAGIAPIAAPRLAEGEDGRNAAFTPGTQRVAQCHWRMLPRVQRFPCKRTPRFGLLRMTTNARLPWSEF